MEIALGGKSYTVGWTWGAKRRLKEIILARGTDTTSVLALSDHLPTAVWAGLDEETRAKVTVEEIEESLNPRNETEVIEKMGSLWKASEPDPEPEGKVSPVAVKTPTTGPSTSMNSVQSESTISA